MQIIEYMVLTCTWPFEIQEYLVLTSTFLYYDAFHDHTVSCPWGGGTPSLRVSTSRYAPRFCHPFSASGWSFCPPKFDHVYYFIQILLGPISKPHIFSMEMLFLPPKLTKSIILFRSCWVPFWTLSGTPLLILTRSAPPGVSCLSVMRCLEGMRW